MAGTGQSIHEIISKPGKWGNPPIPTNDSLHPLSAGNKIYFLKFEVKIFGIFCIKFQKNVS